MSVVSVSGMSPNKPYLLRAMHEWISDNNMTPYMLVDASVSGVLVPAHAVKDGKVVLNLALQAVTALELGNDVISFRARFSGVAQVVNVPIDAVLAIYAQENGQGLMFSGDDIPPSPDTPPDGGNEVDATPETSDAKPARGKPRLHVVK